MAAADADSIRLNKFISDTGMCSRRDADRFVEEGRVTVNGKTAELGTRIFPGDHVKVDGKLLRTKEAPLYIAFNKPVGITCTTDTSEKNNIIDFIRHPKRIFPIGRLDNPSEGLIFLTNDGNIVNKILRAGNNHEKEYLVTVNKPITPDFIQKMSNGIPILDTVTQKCFVKKESPYVFRIILTQGLNRQIRRMCTYLGYSVTKLKRIRIMNISLGNLKTGEWRYFTPQEIQEVNRLVADSAKTEEASAITPKKSSEKRIGKSRPQGSGKPAFGKKAKAGKFTAEEVREEKGGKSVARGGKAAAAGKATKPERQAAAGKSTGAAAKPKPEEKRFSTKNSKNSRKTDTGNAFSERSTQPKSKTKLSGKAGKGSKPTPKSRSGKR